ncbi:uncharacterized protein PRCAT00003086001 [Priceomyces carsonii]|uniref:uncharacterized protein n=1 Tax=Priceomyces carsonii TaxID=28549 RepID=UPI002ED88AEC|nr:unnamed protein product [Priceomyces carsonii]
MFCRQASRTRCSPVGRRMYASVTQHDQKYLSARENINVLLEQQDRSSYILAQYVPEPARDAFLAIRGFNLEINKINDGGKNKGSVSAQASNQLKSTMGVTTADMKFKFWSDMLARIFADPYSDKDIGEPIAILLREAIKNDLNMDISYFHQFLQTRSHFLKNKYFNTVDDICSYGEGTYSQLNYLTQSLLLSPSISPSAINVLEYSESLQSLVSDIAAHIGQATAIASMILGIKYYSTTRNQVTLPISIMTKYDLSQESLLSITQGHSKNEDEISDFREKLKNVVYETATTANDHIISARSKLSQVQSEIKNTVEFHSDDQYLQRHARRWRRNIPDAIFTPFMVSIPTSLYLQKLEKYDFDVMHPKLQQKEWRLAWTSYKNYHFRRI